MECLYNRIGGSQVPAERWKEMLVFCQSQYETTYWNSLAMFLHDNGSLITSANFLNKLNHKHSLIHWRHELYDYVRTVWSPTTGKPKRQVYPAPPSPPPKHLEYEANNPGHRAPWAGSGNIVWQRKQGFLTTGARRRAVSTYFSPPSPVDFDDEGGNIFYAAEEIADGNGRQYFPHLMKNPPETNQPICSVQ